MRLILLHSIITVCVLLIGCSRPEPFRRFNVEIRNESNKNLTLDMFIDFELYESVDLPIQAEFSCSYSLEAFGGLSYCPPNVNVGSGFGRIDSLVISFENAKGYICPLQLDDNSSCFRSGRNPLEKAGFEENSNNYTFIITQEDYENAHVLPE